MLGTAICISQKVNITLLMPDLQAVMSYLYHIVVYDTTLTNANRLDSSVFLHSYIFSPANCSFRPENKEELFNLRHSSARNVIERIFGILKQRFEILQRTPRYDMKHQARIPPALCAIHNFIHRYDRTDIPDTDIDFPLEDCQADTGSLAICPPTHESRERAAMRRDMIAQAMWDGYYDQ
jgi:hypothetical protein